MEHMGHKIRQLLEEKKIKQKELAASLNSSPQYVQGLLGKEALSLKTLQKLAKALNVDITIFFEIEDEDNSSKSNIAKEGGANYSKTDKNDYQGCEKYILEISELKSKIIKLQEKIIELETK